MPGFGDVAIGMAALGVGEAVAASGGESLIDVIARVMTDTSPTPVVEATVALTGRHDKVFLRTSAAAGALAASSLLGALPAPVRTPAVLAAGAATSALTTRVTPRPRAAAVGALATAAVVAAGSRLRPRGARGSLAWTVAGAGLLAAARTIQRGRADRYRETIDRIGVIGAHTPVPDDGFGAPPGLSPLITTEGRFFVADVNPAPPRIDARTWRLSVTGLVDRPAELSLAELIDAAVDFDAVMVCVHNREGQGRAGNARWTGVPLTTLFDRVGPLPEATRLITRAVDGYTISLPLDPLRTGELPGYLVIGMNGRPLPPAHGFPARVFVPGLYGQYTGAKWLSELTLSDDDHVDYWWARGWTPEALRVHPHARIDLVEPGRDRAGTTHLGGVAWAPPEGVATVEVAVGQGDWQPAELADELAPAAWRRWRTTLELPPGDHTVRVRAISTTGQVQSGDNRPSFPNGPSGYHRITVTV